MADESGGGIPESHSTHVDSDGHCRYCGDGPLESRAAISGHLAHCSGYRSDGGQLTEPQSENGGLSEDADGPEPGGDAGTAEETGPVDADAVSELVAREVDRRVDERVEERLDGLDEEIAETVEGILSDRLAEATNTIQRQLGGRIDTVEEDFRGKLDDVRDRVIQVKKEADAKAPADHDHEELRQVAGLAEQLDAVESELDDLGGEVDTLRELNAEVDELDGRLDEVEDRLKTLAWVVSDLRDAHEDGGDLEAVDRIKRAAARADIDRAKCENCNNGVELSLLTDPECPHCNATVTNVEAASGWFSKPKLLVASQLESGEET